MNIQTYECMVILKEEVMKKTYKLENIDCANCAMEMQEAISKLEDIESAKINFLLQKLTLTVKDDADLDSIVKKCQDEITKIERECRIVI